MKQKANVNDRIFVVCVRDLGRYLRLLMPSILDNKPDIIGPRKLESSDNIFRYRDIDGILNVIFNQTRKLPRREWIATLIQEDGAHD